MPNLPPDIILIKYSDSVCSVVCTRDGFGCVPVLANVKVRFKFFASTEIWGSVRARFHILCFEIGSLQFYAGSEV